MEILEQLWYGNVNPCEQFLRDNKSYLSALGKAAKEIESFTAILTPAQGKAFEQAMQEQMDMHIIEEKEAFITGFRLGVQITAGALHKT